MTQYLRPRSLPEALTARRDHPDWLVIAGGTDAMVAAHDRPAPAGLLDLFGLPALTGVRAAGGEVQLGAATPYAAILAERGVHAALPALTACIREIGAAQIQARGTLGGNVATSSPVGDTLPVLLALDARVVLASTAGERTVPYREFCTGYRKTALRPDELIVRIDIPVPAPDAHQSWRKVGTRRAQSISKVMAAAHARVVDGKLADCRVALGAVADRPIRVAAVERALEGQRPSAELAQAAAAAARGAIKPIDDVRSSADYRSFVAGNLVQRFVLQVAAGARA